MSSHWDKMTTLFEALAYLVKQSDTDGIDLHFTVSSEQVSRSKSTGKLVEKIKRHKREGVTDMTWNLDRILENYREQFHRKKPFFNSNHKVRPLTLYVLTDGIWEAECDPSPVIKRMVKRLEELQCAESQVGIQFISFGEDPLGLNRLQRLDDDLELERSVHIPFSLSPAA